MGLFSRDSVTPKKRAEHEARAAAWEDALARQSLPPFVVDRLQNAAIGKQPWVATMSPAELLLAKSHGVKPIATVSGTCWFHYGWSWTEGHEEGWHHALNRIRREAIACGANAIVDVRMRTLRHSFGPSMDFTLIGTAIRVDGLKPSPDPIVATVPALEFVRLLEMGIVPVGIAVGARYDWLGGGYGNGWGSNAWGGRQTQWQTSAFAGNQPLTELGDLLGRHPPRGACRAARQCRDDGQWRARAHAFRRDPASRSATSSRPPISAATSSSAPSSIRRAVPTFRTRSNP